MEKKKSCHSKIYPWLSRKKTLLLVQGDLPKAESEPSESFNNLRTLLYEGTDWAIKNNIQVDAKEIVSTVLQGMGSGSFDAEDVRTYKGMDSASMVAVGFLVVANILERFEDVLSNKKECLDLLKEMLKLAKLVKDFEEKERRGELQDEIEAATALIVKSSIMCCAQINSPKFSQFFKTATNKKDIDQIKNELDTVYRDLHIKMLSNANQKLDGLSRYAVEDKLKVQERKAKEEDKRKEKKAEEKEIKAKNDNMKAEEEEEAKRARGAETKKTSTGDQPQKSQNPEDPQWKKDKPEEHARQETSGSQKGTTKKGQ